MAAIALVALALITPDGVALLVTVALPLVAPGARVIPVLRS